MYGGAPKNIDSVQKTIFSIMRVAIQAGSMQLIGGVGEGKAIF